MEEENDDFDKTLIWSTEEENARALRSTSEIGSFYLVLGAFAIFVIVFFILFFANRGKKMNALEMMRDPNNVFDDVDEDEQEEVEAEEVPLIDIPDDVNVEEVEPITDNMLPAVAVV